MIQYLPAIASLISTGVGAIQEGKQRNQMAAERQKWNAENESLFNKDYYSDYTQRADTQNLIKRMRDEMKSQNKIEQNTAAVTGATPEVQNASKEQRNKAMTSVFGNIAAQGSQFKDRAKDRYLSRRTALEGMEYDNMNQNAASSNNLMYNGIKGMGATDWASIVAGPAKVENKWDGLTQLPIPKVGV